MSVWVGKKRKVQIDVIRGKFVRSELKKYDKASSNYT